MKIEEIILDFNDPDAATEMLARQGRRRLLEERAAVASETSDEPGYSLTWEYLSDEAKAPFRATAAEAVGAVRQLFLTS